MFMVLYTQVPTVAPPTDSRVVYDLPLYDTLYIIELQCKFSVVAIVSSLIQINARSATINKPKVADKTTGYALCYCLWRLYVCRVRAYNL